MHYNHYNWNNKKKKLVVELFYNDFISKMITVVITVMMTILITVIITVIITVTYHEITHKYFYCGSRTYKKLFTNLLMTVHEPFTRIIQTIIQYRL
jgi:hypothetical protein